MAFLRTDRWKWNFLRNYTFFWIVKIKISLMKMAPASISKSIVPNEDRIIQFYERLVGRKCYSIKILLRKWDWCKRYVRMCKDDIAYTEDTLRRIRSFYVSLRVVFTISLDIAMLDSVIARHIYYIYVYR